MTRANVGRRAFTVAEALVASAIATALLVIVWTLFTRTVSRGLKTSERLADLSAVFVILGNLETDLQGAGAVETGAPPDALLVLHPARVVGGTDGETVRYTFDARTGQVRRNGRLIRTERLEELELRTGEAWVDVVLAVRDPRSDQRRPELRRYHHRIRRPGRGEEWIASAWRDNARLEDR